MLVNGIPNKDLLQPDGIHLNDKGISLLAGNIKRAIHIALDIPPPPRRSVPLSNCSIIIIKSFQ
jgi:hypothetical protein